MTSLALLLQAGMSLPLSAADDVMHVAIAAGNAIPILLTWNCKHLANATKTAAIQRICARAGFHAPAIVTVDEIQAWEANNADA